MRGMTLRRDLANQLNSLITTPSVAGASTAVADPDDLAPLPCLPGCITDHSRDVNTKCCEATTLVGSVTPSYGEPSIDVTALSYTEGQLRSAEIQLGTAPRAWFLDPDQALALAQLLIEAHATATTAARE
jgi:hypothetical protein